MLFGADEMVAKWVAKRLPGDVMPHDRQTAIGIVRKDGPRLAAGVTYEQWNGPNVFAGIAADPGSDWASRKTLYAIFSYPFLQLGVETMTVAVASSNQKSLDLVTRLGFVPEALCRNAAYDGSTLVFLKMTRDSCGWIGNAFSLRRRLQGPYPSGPLQDGFGGIAVQPA